MTTYHDGEKEVHEATAVAIGDEKPVGNVTEVNTNSVALSAAIAAQKPSLWSPNMIKLYFIMSIGYLVSTMNGFGMYYERFLLLYFFSQKEVQTQSLTHDQPANSCSLAFSFSPSQTAHSCRPSTP